MRSGHEGRGGRSSIANPARSIPASAARPPATKAVTARRWRPRRVAMSGSPRSRACGLARPRTRSTCGPARATGRSRDPPRCSRSAQVLLREVEAAVRQVLAHVLKMLGHLEAAADRVGELDPVFRGGAEDVEDHAADRLSGQGAVGEEVVEGRVGAHGLVKAVGLDQAVERLRGDVRLTGDRRHPAQGGMSGIPPA